MNTIWIKRFIWLVLTLWSIGFALFIIFSSLPSMKYDCLIVDVAKEPICGSQKYNIKAECENEQVMIYSIQRSYCSIGAIESELFFFAKYPIIAWDLKFIEKYQINSTQTFFKSNGIFYIKPLSDPGIDIFLGCCLLLAMSFLSYITFSIMKKQKYQVLRNEVIEMGVIHSVQ